MMHREPITVRKSIHKTFRTLFSLLLPGLVLATPAFAQTDFSWSPEVPEIGETVEFTIPDSSATPVMWEFGGTGCDDQQEVFDCSWAPEHCRHITFQYDSPGAKTVRLTTDEGELEQLLQVSDAGECCAKEARPDAAFGISPNPTFVGQEVVFTDHSSNQGPPVKSVGLEWYPADDLEIGEQIVFRLTGIDSVRQVDWSFGEPGCGDLEATQTCVPTIVDCLSTTFTYATAGTKTVQASVDFGSFTLTGELLIHNWGACDEGGGGGNCNFSLSPTTADFDAGGGTGAVNVTTGPDCEWTANENTGWVTILSGANGTGNGVIEYSVSENQAGTRQARILVGNKSHAIRQAAADPEIIDNEPTEWAWSVHKDDVVYASSDQPSFTASFYEPGLYSVDLWATNCRGSNLATGVLLIEEPTAAEGGWLVPSAVRAPGLNDTQWRTDLSIYNPADSTLFLVLEFRPDNTNNVGAELKRWGIEVAPGATAFLEDVLTLIPGVVENPDDSHSGSILVTISSGGEGRQPRISSRTYNLADEGTYGQFVQAAAVPVPEHEYINLTGLVHNDAYRTNVRFSNTGDEPASPVIRLIDTNGFEIAELRDRLVPPRSTFQINGIAAVAGVDEPLDAFTVRIETASDTLLAWASVVDNITGDPVLYNPITVDHASAPLWLPGVANLAGANDSQWQSDATVFNPEDGPLECAMRYVPSEDLGSVPDLVFDGFKRRASRMFVDILGEHVLPPGTESKGYFVLHGANQNPSLQPAARTYNLSEGGGTFGQNLFVFRGTSLIEAGNGGAIPGIAVSSDSTTGSRTNLGVLNTDEEEWTQVRITVLDHEGAIAGELNGLWLEPGQLIQFNIADRLGLGDLDLRGTILVDNLSGGHLAAYASVVDNRTQDPILIPATPNAAVN